MKIRVLSAVFFTLIFSVSCNIGNMNSNDLPEVNYSEFTALVKDHAIKKMYKVARENNVLEIVLDQTKDEVPSIRALKVKYHGWPGATPVNRPHLKLNSTWTEEIEKRIEQTEIENNYTNLIPIVEIK
jgi:hypothetical protein